MVSVSDDLEVQQGNNLHFLVEEMQRWREIIGSEYLANKQERLRSTQY
jgi:hypothetical protein